jgi:hypothetical protein
VRFRVAAGLPRLAGGLTPTVRVSFKGRDYSGEWNHVKAVLRANCKTGPLGKTRLARQLVDKGRRGPMVALVGLSRQTLHGDAGGLPSLPPEEQQSAQAH